MAASRNDDIQKLRLVPSIQRRGRRGGVGPPP